MKKAAGFITLHRQIMDWEWYRHPHTAFLFIHLLLSANYVDGLFKGITIRRGQLVTSLTKLSTDTGLSIQQARTALNHLCLTGEVTDQANNQYRIITVVKYDDYQKLTDKSTGNQQATNMQSNRQLTGNSQTDQQQYNNNNNINNVNKETINKERGTAKRFTPPTKDEIEIFCLENGLSIDVNRFINHYESNGWMVGKNKMKNWQATVRNWAARDIMTAQAPDRRPAPAPRRINSAANFEQRDYSDVPDDDMARLAAEMEQARKDGII